MLLIWGTRGLTTKPEKGDFHCPSCSKSNYILKRVRKWFTLYFIPVIPLNKLGEYVECQKCKDTYNERILEWDPEGDQAKFDAEFSIAAKRVMLKIALADGVVDDSEIDQITRQFSAIIKTDVDRGDIEAELEAAKSDTRTVVDYLKSVVGGLNDTGKERVLSAAMAVAMADGDFDQSERELINELGEALMMSKAHVRGVIAEGLGV